MKKLFLAVTVLAIGAASVQRAEAGHNRWSVRGAVSIGGGAGWVSSGGWYGSDSGFSVGYSSPGYYGSGCGYSYPARAYCASPVVYESACYPTVVYRRAPVVRYDYGGYGHRSYGYRRGCW